MKLNKHLMEGDEESYRLDIKTDGRVVEEQARWAGIRAGMRVADLGCGAGKTTFHLNKLVQPQGATIGIDFVEQRIQYAKDHYSFEGIEYSVRDIRESLEDLGTFDFIWIRFVLEYYLAESFEIVKNVCRILKPGGIICLTDLDCNCLRHYGIPPRLEKAVNRLMKYLEDNFNFDPYVGIKLYSYLFDLNYEEIDVRVTPHNLIFGQLQQKDDFNWTKKIEFAAEGLGYQFEEYAGKRDEFYREFKTYFSDHRRFTYTPMISCRGRKPAS
jgi:ubiquinone/menaquinone biosynthesis C-methylase UbiE